MLIDKKREQMYSQCRERKKQLDKQLAIARGALLVPPMVVMIGSVIYLFMHLLRGTLYVVSSAELWGAHAAPPGISLLAGIFGGAALTVFAACLTVFRTPEARKYYVGAYCGMIILGLILVFGPRLSDAIFIVVYSAFAIPIAKWNESLTKKDEEMSRLDGYPHFNPILIRHTETPYGEKPVSTDDMTPDERIMFERGWGKGDEDRR